MDYVIKLTEAQEKAIKIIAPDRQPQETIDEQVNYYIKQMLDREAQNSLLIKSGETDGLKDSEAAELLAVVINAKQDYLDSLEK